MDTDTHQHAAAVHEVAADVDDDQEDEEYGDDDADDSSGAEGGPPGDGRRVSFTWGRQGQRSATW